MENYFRKFHFNSVTCQRNLFVHNSLRLYINGNVCDYDLVYVNISFGLENEIKSRVGYVGLISVYLLEVDN